jgi:DNA-binding HxlR family transcriptional regulator
VRVRVRWRACLIALWPHFFVCHNQTTLTAASVKQRRGEATERAGTCVLSLLAMPLNEGILGALAEGSQSLVRLRRLVGSPAESTLRLRLQNLIRIGAVGGTRQNGFAGSLNYELTGSGRELLQVADVLKAWLASAPEGPLPLGGTAAKSAVRSLVAGWGTSMLRALAARPLSLTELDSLIGGLSYPSLERRLTTMRLAGHVEPVCNESGGQPYEVTDWLRHATAPLACAIRWEREHMSGDVRPAGNRDIDGFFLLALPLLCLPEDLAGECRLSVELPGSSEAPLAGVTVGVEKGRIESCVSRMDGDCATWASGSVPAWSRAVIDEDKSGLDFSGDLQLANDLVSGLHQALFRR